MDALDVRIIETMGIYPYGQWPHPPERLQASYIARTLRSSVNTVKARVARMEREGIIAGYQVTPNFRHLGLNPTAYLFRVEGEEGSAPVEQVAQDEGVLEVHDFLGQGLCLLFAYNDQEGVQAHVDRLRARTGGTRPLLFHDWTMPPLTRALTPLDWRILQALRGHAKASPYAVAERVGVAGSTVQRRIDRMVREQSVAFTVLFDASKASGLFPFVLALYFEGERDAATVRRILEAFDGSRLTYDATASAELGHFAMVLFAHNMAEVDDLRRRGSGIEGVRHAEPWFLRGLKTHPEWLDALIDERVRATGPGLASPDAQIRQAD